MKRNSNTSYTTILHACHIDFEYCFGFKKEKRKENMNKELVPHPANKCFEPHPAAITYLNSAGCSAIPNTVKAAGEAAIFKKATPWNGIGNDNDIEQIRILFARMLHSTPDCISYGHCTSYAISLAAFNIQRSGDLVPGDEVLVLADDMSSAIYPWQYICEANDLKLSIIKRPSFPAAVEDQDQQSEQTTADVDWTALILSKLTDGSRVAVVAVPHVHWCDGSIIDLQAISDGIAALRRANQRESNCPEITCRKPYFVVDGTQSIGMLPLSVNPISVNDAFVPTPSSTQVSAYLPEFRIAYCPSIDFIACSVHKWLLGPYGTSLTYVAPKHHKQWIPLAYHERNHVGNDDLSYWDETGAMRSDSTTESGITDVPNISSISTDTEATLPGSPKPLDVGYPCVLFDSAAKRLDIGGRPNPILLPMVRAALEFHAHWNNNDHGTFVSYCRQLTNHMADRLKPLISNGYLFILPAHKRCGHIFGVRVNSKPTYVGTASAVSSTERADDAYSSSSVVSYAPHSAAEIASHLKTHCRVLIAVRYGFLRISPYIYNTIEDVDRLCDCLIDYLLLVP